MRLLRENAWRATVTNDGLLNQLRLGWFVGNILQGGQKPVIPATTPHEVQNSWIVLRNGKIPSILLMFTVVDVASPPQIKKGA